jgi:hypothetical protein
MYRNAVLVGILVGLPLRVLAAESERWSCEGYTGAWVIEQNQMFNVKGQA